jgi:transcription-repair coupling factor (superfamily II helicase)
VIKSKLSTTDILESVFSSLVQSKTLKIQGISPNAHPWLAASLALKSDKPVLWILPTEKQAEQAYWSARFFIGETESSSSDPFDAKISMYPLHLGLPYDDLSPDRFAVAERLGLLFRLVHAESPPLLISSTEALMHLGINKAALDQASMLILQGQEIDRIALAQELTRLGYLNVPLVEDPGSFAIRGGIIDIFTALMPLPVRIELLGDEVESIRTFDPETQRTDTILDSVYLSPVREIFQDDDSIKEALAAIEHLAGEQDVSSRELLSITRPLKDKIWFFGIEALLPAFHASLDTLFDFLPPETILLVDDPGGIQQTSQELWQQACQAYKKSVSAGTLVYPPERLLLAPEALEQKLAQHKNIYLGLTEDDGPSVDIGATDVVGLRRSIQNTPVGPDGQDPLDPFVALIKDWHKSIKRPFVVASRADRKRELARMLRLRNIPIKIEEDPYSPDLAESPGMTQPIRLVSGDIAGGFACPAAGIAFVPDAEVFGRSAARKVRKAISKKPSPVKPGDYIVHVDFGIAKFDCLTKLEVAGLEADYLLLKFRDDDKLYLPVTRMNLVESYQGSSKHQPALSKLGTKTWEKTKLRVQQALLEMADELIRIEATRKSLKGVAVKSPSEEFDTFEASFPFEETADQGRAIEEVVQDITRPQAMDRLVCGDVGFGKTEVAIRAAFLNILSGHQVAILVPTTILALQHLSSFRARFEEQAVRIEMLSRLIKKKDQQSIIQDLAAGNVDVVIGTHRLLGEDVDFKSLGLVVIDEEHRFGVRHKEKLKKLKKNVDILTMTATPLPRTLQLSLTGLRNISVIQSPPPGRRSIRSIVTRFAAHTIAEAINRERQRGGQVFFVHNWVRGIAAMERFINKTVPEAKTAIAHGQMKESQLEKVMTDFIQRKIDVLVCTSIIESGLDIPSANTIVINRADRFGLAQLHQIRGRVGRASERAYAYFLIPGLSAITQDARMRLETISEHSDPGSGYKIAAEDMEIRGAGNLLGKDQSGHIAAVGFDLYRQLLERAVIEAKGGHSDSLKEPEISLPLAGVLPEDYIPDLEHRLDLYARISRARDNDELFELENELIDRFGPIPPETETLFEIMTLKSLMRKARIASLECKGFQLQLTLDIESALNMDKIVKLVKQESERMTIDPKGQIVMQLRPEERSEIIETSRFLMSKMI